MPAYVRRKRAPLHAPANAHRHCMRPEVHAQTRGANARPPRPPARTPERAHLEVGLEQQVDVVLADLRVPAKGY